MGSAAPPGGALAPQQIRTAYGINLLSQEGAGQTIAIIDAYNDPDLVSSNNAAYATSDLHHFDAYYGLPDFGGSGPTFTKLDENGGTNYPAAQSGGNNWESEEALDVEWAHAIAPEANIVLMEASSASFADLISTAVSTACNLPGVSVVSMSFGGSDSSFDSASDSSFTTPNGHAGITFLAASGDSGAPVCYPASSPNVVAVGGTSLMLSGGNYGSETAWSGSGGGISAYESQPSYQHGLVIHNGAGTVNPAGMRANPDVAFDADPNTGVAVYDSYNGGSSPWFQIGGTSLATPCWAGLIALADQLRVSAGLSTLDGPTQTLPRLYTLPAADFHDVTSGTSGGSPNYTAAAGYDLVTGLGTPVANLLVPGLAGNAGALAIGPASLPSDAVNLAYNQVITAIGGTGSITLSVSNLHNPIAGLTVPTSGSNSLTITGTPTAVGTETFTVTATDSQGNTTSINYSITVNVSTWSMVGLGDFTGDGKTDVLWENQSTGVVGAWITGGGWLGLGTASLNSGWTIAGVGDFNGDKKADILWQNTSTGQVGASITGGSWLSLGLAPLNAGWTIAGLGDFTGDKKADVLWQNTNTGLVGAWITGGGWLGLGVAPLNAGWRIAGIGDFNGDGKADVLWQNTNTGLVGSWITGGGWLNLGVAPLNAGWAIAGVGDFLGNGKADVLWQNTNTGLVGAWITGGGWLGLGVAPLNAGWTIVGVGNFSGGKDADVLWENLGTGLVGAWVTGVGWLGLGQV